MRKSLDRPVSYSIIINQNKKVNKCLLRVLLALFIEVSSFLDLISDFVILRDLASSTDTAWFTFSLFTMLCPYYTVYTSLINYQIQLIHRRIEKGSNSYLGYLMNCLTILPSMLLLLIGLDLIYMCISVLVYPLIFMFSPCKIG